jgi:hypothetical protein
LDNYFQKTKLNPDWSICKWIDKTLQKVAIRAVAGRLSLLRESRFNCVINYGLLQELAEFQILTGQRTIPVMDQIDPALALVEKNIYEAVVVVCPRGKGGAKRAYDYLGKQGVPEAKLYILTGGMAKWPHPEWVAAN